MYLSSKTDYEFEQWQLELQQNVQNIYIMALKMVNLAIHDWEFVANLSVEMLAFA